MSLSEGTLLDSVTGTGTGNSIATGGPDGPSATFSVVVSYATAAPTGATVELEGSIDGTTWVSIGSTTDVTTTAVYFIVTNSPFPQIRGNLSAYTAGACTVW